jgi:hypothetical protein
MMGSGLAPGHARKRGRPDGAAGKSKRTASGGAVIKELISPDDIASVMASPFISAYWPLLLGGPFVFLFMVKGYNWVAIPLAGLTLLGQAWRIGMFV